MLKVVLVDDIADYSFNLFRSVSGQILSRDKRGQIVFYGPKDSRVRTDLGGEMKRVWGPRCFPFEIFRETLKDMPEIVHLQFEPNRLGKPVFSFLFIPLIFLLKLIDAKTVITIHGPIFELKAAFQDAKALFSSRALGFLFMIYIHLQYKIMNKFSDALIVHAEVFRDWLIENGLDGSKIHVVPHGVEDRITEMGNSCASEWCKGKTILFFGVISPRKGIEWLLRSFVRAKPRIRGYKLVIAGFEPPYYGGYKASLEELIGKLGIRNDVIFTGYISFGNLHRLFLNSKIIVFPYIISVGASGPLTYAMKYSKPIIASRTPYFCEVLEDGSDALLVPVNDEESLSNAIVSLTRNKKMQRAFSAKIREKARIYYWNEVAKKTVSLYKNVSNRLEDDEEKPSIC